MKLSAGAIAVILISAVPSSAFETNSYQMSDDFGTVAMEECYLQYYYYIPCPTYNWFWAFSEWNTQDVIGVFFTIGDTSTGTGDTCDPVDAQSLEKIRVLDFAGYGTAYPGLFTVEFDVWCADEQGCPVGPSLWNSGPLELHFAWNYIEPDSPVSLCQCATFVDPPSHPRVLISARHIGSDCSVPEWGSDGISTPILMGCTMHDLGCAPALYPRPYVSHYSTMHSGYYGYDFEYCPPQWFPDERDTTPGCAQFGYVELAWRIYVQSCSGIRDPESPSWGKIKSIFK
jgi:hypothetical protein